MDDDWDLQAVVRSCTAATSSTTAELTGCAQIFNPFQQDYSFSSDSCQGLLEGKTGNPIEVLHDLYKPFFPKSQAVSSQSLPISPLSVLGGLQDLSYDQIQRQPQQLMKQLPQQTQIEQKQQPFSVVVNGTTKTHNSSSRSKRRKNNMKRVCHVTAESSSSDMWSWRKYGQKPIKGSPYPRGYYRCSTSKGCMARKQVERNKSDPGMFILTYTAEHNHPMPTHRNSLAGSTRNKLSETPTSVVPNKISCLSEMSPAMDKLESSRDEAEDEDDDFSVSDMALDDDLFTGLEDLRAEECFSDQFPASYCRGFD